MKQHTIPSLLAQKAAQDPICMLTAYDATFAKLVAEQGVEVILVGDSLGMVMQGHASTIPVSMADMIYHTQCVSRGNSLAQVTDKNQGKKPLLIADMPYMSYATDEQAMANAALLMQAGANMVKLEGGEWLVSTVKKLTERGVPVCAHLGLTPQSVDAFGGFKVQGRDEVQAKKIMADALLLEQSGASLLVLECVPQKLARQISQQLKIPTIGIGAGVATDGQVLVLQDLLGLNGDFRPKFVRNFMADQSAHSVADAVNHYVVAVKSRQFPAPQHCFD